MAEQKQEQEEQKSGGGCCLIFAIVGAIIAALLLVLFTVIIPKIRDNGGNTDGATKLLSRSANYNDIDVDFNDDLSLHIEIVITPKTDINNLQLTFKFTDKDENEVTTRTRVLGNVTKGTKYSVVYQLSEFSLSQIFKISKVYTTVSGGTVSYFG